MFSNCIITLNEPSNIYHPGQLLSGNVRLALSSESRSVRGEWSTYVSQRGFCENHFMSTGIFVEIKGRAHCQLYDTEQSYIGLETYLKERHYFVGGQNGELTWIMNRLTGRMHSFHSLTQTYWFANQTVIIFCWQWTHFTDRQVNDVIIIKWSSAIEL